MNRYRNWVQRLPLPLLFVFLFLLWTALHVLISTDGLDSAEIIGNVVGGLIFAAVLTAVIGARRRRIGGREKLIEYTGAVRSGRLPADVDGSAWEQSLDHDRRVALRSRWLIPGVVALPVAAGVVLIAIDPADMGAAALLIAAFAGLGAVSMVLSERQRKRIESLREQLRSRQGTNAAESPAN